MRALALPIVMRMLAACSPMVYVHNVPNLARVDDNVYRSGQITTREGWLYIQQLAAGRTVHVLKLNYDTEGDDEIAASMGFDVHNVAMEPRGDQDAWDDVLSVFKGPDDNLADIAEHLLEGAGPHDLWIVHCTHGQDRTGFTIGRYRVLHDGWTKDAAYTEMLEHDFHPELHGIHEAWERFTPPAR